MAKYMLLIYEDEAGWADAGPEVLDQVLGGHRGFVEANHGAIQGGDALEPTGTATSLRRQRAGAFTVTDGAFAETKEALGGYYLVDAANLDDAIALAEQIPAPFGGVEVRPVRTFD